jgi:hypothetical protein
MATLARTPHCFLRSSGTPTRRHRQSRASGNGPRSQPHALCTTGPSAPNRPSSPVAESLRDSRPEKSLRDSRPEKSLRDSRPEKSLRDSRPEKSLRDSRPEKSLRDSRPERSLRDSRPERSLRDSEECYLAALFALSVSESASERLTYVEPRRDRPARAAHRLISRRAPLRGRFSWTVLARRRDRSCR